VIKGFRCADTRALFETGKSKRFGAILTVATRKLTQLDAAATLEFLKSPPGNHLEVLKGDRKGQQSIRINDQWRICFRWTTAGPEDVEIADYHGRSMAMRIRNGMRPLHPGEVLREDFLRPAGLTANALAKALHVPAPRVNDIVRERRGVSADTAMRLARYFGGDARSWLNLQAIYDLRLAEIANARKIEREIMPIAV
jgi:addiction module HigA family antidote